MNPEAAISWGSRCFKMDPDIAFTVLGRSRKRALKELSITLNRFVQQLSSPDQTTKVAALDAIGSMLDSTENLSPEPQVVRAVLDLTSNPDGTIASKATSTLGTLGSIVPDAMRGEVVGRLLTLIEDPSTTVFDEASWSLVMLEDFLSVETRTRLLRKLLALTEQGQPHLIASALRFLGYFHFNSDASSVVNSLLRFIRDPSAEIRGKAGRSLAWYKFWVPEQQRVEVVEALVRLTGDSDDKVRESAMAAIERGSDPGLTLLPSYAAYATAVPPSHHRIVVDRFIALTYDDSVFNVRGAAFDLGNICYRLGELSEGTVVQRLLDLATSSDEHIRRNAVFSLKKVLHLVPAQFRDAVKRVVGEPRQVQR